MSFTLSAPYPSVQMTSILPSPHVSDTEALSAEVRIERAQDGTLYSYVKTKGARRKLIWSFSLTRAKGLELRDFITSYASSKIHIEDHTGQKWSGNFTNNPFEFYTPGRGGVPASPTDVAAEMQTNTLEFEGVKLA